MKPTAALIAACSIAYALLAVGTPALADPLQPEELQTQICSKVPIEAWGDPGEIQTMIEEMGYTTLNVRIEKGCWEVKAVDGERQVYEFYVHPVSKEIVLKKHKPLGAE